MSRYQQHNPDEPVRHDWLKGATRAKAQGSLAAPSGSAGPRTLEAKWLDPACWDGCQSLILKSKCQRLLDAIEEIRQVSTGERQVGNDDTDGLDWIARRIAALDPPNESSSGGENPDASKGK